MFFHDSPFAQRLDTNYIPSDPELDQLRALLAEPLDELARIDARINELDVLLHQLKTRRESLNAEIEPYKALISPLRRIPQDILQEIFFACLPTAHNALIDPGEAPLLLGRICRHWRSVAYSTPMLWSSLHIPVLSPTWSSIPQNIEHELERVVATWLDRSAACPLSISLFRSPYNVAANLVLPSTVSHLIRVAPRLRHLSICVHTSEMQQLLLFDAKDLPCLESVHIQSPSDLTEGWDEALILQIPSLRQISLHITADALTLPLRWSELTDLSLECFRDWNNGSNGNPGGLDQNGAQELLRRCPNLARCQLRATKHVPFIADSTITLPYLDALILLDAFDSAQFLQALVLPKLNYLGVGGESPGSTLRSFQSSTHAFTLEILDRCQVPPEGLLDLFDLFPAISRIRAGWFGFNQGFLTGLHPSTILSPALTHVELGICFLSDAALLDFIRARLTPVRVHPLQRVEARFLRPMEVDIVEELQPFISQGLQVELHYTQITPSASPQPLWKFNPRDGIHTGPADV
ncbi:hypothetical protein DFH09DRAFT_1028880 [Mycena vulgaris]|nr:hypothetical protein DFH09DRAFT_1028880 [Mycena vulgaris]